MRTNINKIWAFIQDEEGQDIIEYGLLAAFIATIILVLILLFKEPIVGLYNAILNKLNYMNSQL